MCQDEKQQISHLRKGRGFIDKNHPNADWSGYVPPSLERKHFYSGKDRKLRENIAQKGNNVDYDPTSSLSKALCTNLKPGLLATEEAESRELKIPRRRKGPTVQNASFNRSPGGFEAPILGGITPISDPDRYSSKRWQSENTKQMELCSKTKVKCDGVSTSEPIFMKSLATDLDQLTEKGRRSFIRGKKSVPRNLEDSTAHHRKNNQPTKKINEKSSFSLIGCRSNFSNSKSLLSGLGKDIVRNLDTVKESAYVPSAPYATEKYLPTDPYYVKDQGNRQKELTEENFKGVVPGYTGKCNSIKK